LKTNRYVRLLQIRSRSKSTAPVCRLALRAFLLLFFAIKHVLAHFVAFFVKKTLDFLAPIVGIGLLAWIVFQLIAVTDRLVISDIAITSGFRSDRIAEAEDGMSAGDFVLLDRTSGFVQGVCADTTAQVTPTVDRFRYFSTLAGRGQPLEGLFAWLQRVLQTDYRTDRTVEAWHASNPVRQPDIPADCVETIRERARDGECITIVDNLVRIRADGVPIGMIGHFRPGCVVDLEHDGPPQEASVDRPNIVSRFAFRIGLIRRTSEHE
jgi:hypothetical protein